GKKCAKSKRRRAARAGRPAREVIWDARANVDRSGGAGIRTQGTLSRPTVFKTAPFDRSGTPPSPILLRGGPQPSRNSNLLRRLPRMRFATSPVVAMRPRDAATDF